MDRTRFEQAKKIVLRYYETNGYSESRQAQIRHSLELIARIIESLDIELDDDAIQKIVKQRRWSYTKECNLRHVRAMLLIAMESGSTESRFIRHRPPRSLESGDFSETLGRYLLQLERMGKAKRTVEFERFANKDLLLYLESIGIRRFESITAGHLESYLMLRIPAVAKSTGQAIVYRLRHFFEHLSLEKGLDASLLRALDVRIKVPGTIVTALTEEQERILTASRRPTNAGEARSRAVTLLCLRLGLRKSDVYNSNFALAIGSNC